MSSNNTNNINNNNNNNNNNAQQNSDMSVQQKQQLACFEVNKQIMKCPIESHEMQRQKYICIDPTCSVALKEGCADCFLEDHVGHQRMNIEHFISNLKQRYSEADQQLDSLTKEQKMEDFKTEVNQDIDNNFEDIQQQVMNKFKEFKEDLKIHLQKKAQVSSLNSSSSDSQQQQQNPFLNSKQTINQLSQISQQKFHELKQQDIQNCISFYQTHEQIKKNFTESQIQINKVKQIVLKNKSKYFDRLRNLWADILNEHSDNQSTADESSEDYNNNSSNQLSGKKRQAKKRVSFASELSTESPNKDLINNNTNNNNSSINIFSPPSIIAQSKFSTPRKKVKGNNTQQQQLQQQQLIEQQQNQQEMEYV